MVRIIYGSAHRTHIIFRVMEVSDVFGLNMTYEVARQEDRSKSFFKCSLTICSFNGQCIVQVYRGIPKELQKTCPFLSKMGR